MKKYLMLASIVFFAISCNNCKKEKQESNSSDNQENEQIVLGEIAGMKKIDEKELSALITAKNNDTTYVTNFFATWCGPCVREMPHFVEKMKETEGQPIKFTFVSVDEESDWHSDLKDFAEKFQLTKHIVIAGNRDISQEFYLKNFKTYDGGSIPFTFIIKGNKTSETVGSMSRAELDEKIASVQ